MVSDDQNTATLELLFTEDSPSLRIQKFVGSVAQPGRAPAFYASSYGVRHAPNHAKGMDYKKYNLRHRKPVVAGSNPAGPVQRKNLRKRLFLMIRWN
jgi:hypothetical protein